MLKILLKHCWGLHKGCLGAAWGSQNSSWEPLSWRVASSKSWLHWSGHVARMSLESLARQVLLATTTGKRLRGRPRIVWRDQGCGAGTQISHSCSGSSSRHLKFLAQAPKWIGPLNTENHCIICTTRFPHKLGLWSRNPMPWTTRTTRFPLLVQPACPTN